MSQKKEKNSANYTNPNNDDILVYEPIRRNCTNEENESNGNAKLKQKFTGLYNRGKKIYYKFLYKNL